MTLDNLASGLIGAVIGGLIVVLAEQWRWRRENRAAARMVLIEVNVNISYLNRVLSAAPEKRSRSDIGMFSTSIWEAERVRAASVLDVKGQMALATAYQGASAIIRLLQASPEAAEAWLGSKAASDSLRMTLVMLRLVDGALQRVVPIPSRIIDDWNREIEKAEAKTEPQRA
jgi:hypothetical protein